MKKYTFILIASFVLLVALAESRADVVRLYSGGKIRGKVVFKSESIVRIKTPFNTIVTYSMDEVESIVRTGKMEGRSGKKPRQASPKTFTTRVSTPSPSNKNKPKVTKVILEKKASPKDLPEKFRPISRKERLSQGEKIKAKGRWKFWVRSRHYDVFSNGYYQRTIRLAKLMDAMYYHYRKIFGYKGPHPRPFTIYLYLNQKEFMSREKKQQQVAGFYDGKKMACFHTNDGKLTQVTLFHEGTHQFQDLVLPGLFTLKHAKMWLIEGLAVYFEESKISGRNIYTGRISMEYLRPLKQAIQQGQYTPLKTLLEMGPERFGALEYAQSWSLIHFFVHAYRGKNRKYFKKYFHMVRNGKGDPVKNFSKVFKKPLPVIEHYWKQYVLSMKGR